MPYTFCKNEFKLNTSGYNNAFLDDFFEKQAEIGLKNDFSAREGVEIQFFKSLILAQDERWRRA